jgi:molecular chaperone HscB
MICWSCQKAAGEGALCASCGAVQPPNAEADYFAVLGIPRAFAVDVADLERRYKDMTKTLHPDRFARADPKARRASLERSIQLNEAWRTLKDPVRRAEYLLSLHGVAVGEAGKGGRQEQSGGQVTQPVPQALLMEILEVREALAEAQAKKDLPGINTLIAKVRTHVESVMWDVARAFAASPVDLGAAAARLMTVRYYQRFLDEAMRIAEAVSDEGGKDLHAG